jgi:lipopolysaccharide exporter
VILIALGTKQNWVSGADLLRIYGFASVLNMITMQSGVVCDATAYLKPKLVLNASYFFVVGILFYLFRGYDLIGYAYALLIAEIIRNIAYTYLMRRILQLDYYTYYKSLLPALLICAFVSTFVYGATVIASYLHFSYVIGFVLQMLAGAVALGLAMFLPIPFLHRQMEWLLKKLSEGYANPKISKIMNWYIRFLNKQTKPI